MPWDNERRGERAHRRRITVTRQTRIEPNVPSLATFPFSLPSRLLRGLLVIADNFTMRHDANRRIDRKIPGMIPSPARDKRASTNRQLIVALIETEKEETLKRLVYPIANFFRGNKRANGSERERKIETDRETAHLAIGRTIATDARTRSVRLPT